MTEEYKEFFANMQDILHGCSDIDRTIELMEELFNEYRPDRPEQVRVPELDNKLYPKPF